jgi:hypothetical protein
LFLIFNFQELLEDGEGEEEIGGNVEQPKNTTTLKTPKGTPHSRPNEVQQLVGKCAFYHFLKNLLIFWKKIFSDFLFFTKIHFTKIHYFSDTCDECAHLGVRPSVFFKHAKLMLHNLTEHRVVQADLAALARHIQEQDVDYVRALKFRYLRVFRIKIFTLSL